MSASDPSWVWPFWLERQLDPSSPDFVPGTAGSELVDLTHRNVTMVGNLATPERVAVDPRGLVTPIDASWSLDWWIGAEDRWHVPSRATGVRQRLVDGAPVVETAMRVPGGDAIARTYGMTSTTLGPCAVIEIRNATTIPFAVVIAVRPFGPLGHLPIHDIALDAGVVTIDGTPSIVFAKPPGRVAMANQAAGDSATHIFAGRAPAVGASPVSVRCEAGWATASFVFPLAHTAVARVVVPLRPPPAAGRRGRDRTSLTFPVVIPTSDQVASGWAVQSRRSLLLSLPDDRLMAALEAAIRHLLLVHGGEDLVLWPDRELDLDAAATVLDALGAFGFDPEVSQVLTGWTDLQALDGTFQGADQRLDANAAVLGAVATHWLRTRDTELVESMIGPLAKGAHWIDKRRGSRRARRDAGAEGLLPDGAAPDYAGPTGSYFRDAARSARALRDLAPALDGAGQPEVAADVRRFAAALVQSLDRAFATVAAETGGAIPPTPTRRLDAGTVANLALVSPLGAHRATDPAVSATIDLVRDHLTLGAAVVQGVGHVGLSPDLTMQLGSAELERGELACLDRLAWMVDIGGDTVGWPTAVLPNSGGGSAGRPNDPVALARFVTLVRRLAVRELEADDGTVVGLALCTVVPPRWLGQSVDVRDAPTALGRCSFSVRWHGDRPALFWEIEPHPGVTTATITAPGLDPAWSSNELHGEVLLTAVPVPDSLSVPAGETDGTGPDGSPVGGEPGVGERVSTFPPTPTAPPDPQHAPPYLAGWGAREVSVDLTDLAGTLRSRAAAVEEGAEPGSPEPPPRAPDPPDGGSFT
jgi:hypothetical protein